MVELKNQDMGEEMQCISHPYTKNPGGICALCLQEKLGKLVTSSFPVPKSNHLSLSLSSGTGTNGRDFRINNNLEKKKKKKTMLAASSSSSSLASSSSSANLIYKRSKSTAAAYGESLSQRKRSGFWSFLHLYSSKHQISSTTNKADNQRTETSKKVYGSGNTDVIVEEEEEEEDESPNKIVSERPTNGIGGGGGSSSFGRRKVLRSRSVGCGSRSFSGDSIGRISNGSGDCTLRRIESQREATKFISNGNDSEAADAMNEMVKCGGIFSGFMIMTSSSTADHHHHKMGNRNWGRAFASPMRAKATTTTTTTHRDHNLTDSSANNKNTSPNLDSIPSLLI